MFYGLHGQLLEAELDLQTKILVALVCDRFDNYSGEFKEVSAFTICNKTVNRNSNTTMMTTRQVDLRSEQNKPLVELIAKQKIDSNNIDAIEEEIEFQVFKFDRNLRSSSRMSTEVPQQKSKTTKKSKPICQNKNVSGPVQIFVNTGLISPKTLVLDVKEDTTVTMIKSIIEVSGSNFHFESNVADE